jgi:hypothetical protein
MLHNVKLAGGWLQIKDVFHSIWHAKTSEWIQGDLKLKSSIKSKSNSIIHQNMEIKFFVIFFFLISLF